MSTVGNVLYFMGLLHMLNGEKRFYCAFIALVKHLIMLLGIYCGTN